MMAIQVKADTAAVERKLDAVGRQMPFVIAKALTNTAQDVQRALRDAMLRQFDRPTPYTVGTIGADGRIRNGATYVKPATKQTLQAEVRLKDEAFKGTPANKYLAPEVLGGPRNIKRVERLLSSKGILPQGMSIVPASGAQLDGFGNPSRGQYSKILAQLGANLDQYQNESKASRKRAASRRRKGAAPVGRYFVPGPKDKQLEPGIWQRFGFKAGSAVKPIFLFVPRPAYRKRYTFYEVAQQTIADRFEENLTAALQYALATQR